MKANIYTLYLGSKTDLIMHNIYENPVVFGIGRGQGLKKTRKWTLNSKQNLGMEFIDLPGEMTSKAIITVV